MSDHEELPRKFSLTCPAPRTDERRILLAHGEGARLTRRLIQDEILTAFDHPSLRELGDAAKLPAIDGKLALSTDSYVVTPLFFPGGDIGRLAVHGTINDLAVSGAEPLYLTVGMILEEGLPLDTLRRVIQSIRIAAAESGVAVVAGDTKVVPRGAADQMFLNVTGVGRLREGVEIGPQYVRPGDAILISGTLGDHGIAILSAREGFDFEGPLSSDSASVLDLVSALVSARIRVRFLRDPTRGGVAAVLHELAEAARITLQIEESKLPVAPAVRGACEVLGIDPLFVANEGKVVAVVSADDAMRAEEIWRRQPLGRHGAVIGKVNSVGEASVLVQSMLRGLRLLDEPAGAPLPRIC